MNKKQEIKFYKDQLESANILKEGARQLEANATRLESEAKSRLKMLGALEGEPRKGKYQLTDELKFNLLANLTK